MNQVSLKKSAEPAPHDGEKESLVKQLLLAAARGTGAGVLRVALALVAAALVNAAGATLALAFSANSWMGRGGPVLFALLIGIPFIIAVGVTGMMAYKQGLMGILSRLLETQAPALGSLGAKFLEKFLTKINYQPGGPVSDALLGQWRTFLKLQDDLPRPLPFLLGVLADKVPFSESITAVASSDMTLQEVAQESMEDMVQIAIEGGLRPESGPLLGALALQFALWVVLAAVLHYR